MQNADEITNNQHIPDAVDQSEVDDYEGFLDLGFMPQAVVPIVPLNVIYPHSYFEVEVPQGTNRDNDFNNDHLKPRKRKASFSGGAHNIEVGCSAIASDPSAPPPSC